MSLKMFLKIIDEHYQDYWILEFSCFKKLPKKRKKDNVYFKARSRTKLKILSYHSSTNSIACVTRPATITP